MNTTRTSRRILCSLFAFAVSIAAALGDTGPVPAADAARVKSQGKWSSELFRYAARPAMKTTESGAALSYSFSGTAVSVRLGGHNVPAYGRPDLGRLVVYVDGHQMAILEPRALPREIVLARNLMDGQHTVRLEHQGDGDQKGVRIESFAAYDRPIGELQFHVSGEANAHLVDCRAILRRGGKVVRNGLVRNWLTGQCSLVGLRPGKGYRLELQAAGWETFQSRLFEIDPGKATRLSPIYLRRESSTRITRFRFPRLNQPAIRKPGESFRARFLGFQAKIEQVKLTRRVGPAVISRVIPFEEDQSQAYYYDREVVATLPRNTPPGVYDLEIRVNGGERSGVCRSPSSVQVVAGYPLKPTLVTFGHLDTSGQNQAEYLERLAAMINLLAPDLVLCSNSCNPAYVSGAFSKLEMPYVINFGNHQFPGHQAWYGDPVGLIDVGPGISVINFGYPWHHDRVKPQVDALLTSRGKARIKIINAFESNAPIAMLDKHRVAMIHDAHGIGKKVMDLGATPTRRIGKSNSESFRIVRFRDGAVTTCTYNGHPTAPIPFGRQALAPVTVAYRFANDGSRARNTATVVNRMLDSHAGGRVTFVVAPGKYKVRGGRMETQIASDDKLTCVLTVRLDFPAKKTVEVNVQRIEE